MRSRYLLGAIAVAVLSVGMTQWNSDGLGVTLAYASKKAERVQMLEAIQRGELMPFETILTKVREELGGHLVEVELEDQGWSPSGWVYEVKWLTTDGQLIKRYYDAQSGALLRDKTKSVRKEWKRSEEWKHDAQRQ
ncbi:PepSY domain-containing protein [Hydrogenophilus thermoluteolus]|uniref:PepSY domain-containing protein n=1 Tax=Hydrogenophilus thermoluteolus TaxID=297 RepID=A0A2Z6DX42_HYDTE|nr:PepSY domain-containing protein [Hydrogenophilus thermoluteolus]BBD76885.1 hypothetical protein HPTL_0617 [Hydrogenophilus thermoluteolus]